ncbi:hypothetical protein D3C76_212400 [compost metagenome]
MSLIQSQSVVTKTTTATLKVDDIKKLVAADLGVDPKSVSLKFDLSYEYNDYRDGSMTGATFSSLEVKVVE